MDHSVTQEDFGKVEFFDLDLEHKMPHVINIRSYSLISLVQRTYSQDKMNE